MAVATCRFTRLGPPFLKGDAGLSCLHPDRTSIALYATFCAASVAVPLLIRPCPCLCPPHLLPPNAWTIHAHATQAPSRGTIPDDELQAFSDVGSDGDDIDDMMGAVASPPRPGAGGSYSSGRPALAQPTRLMVGGAGSAGGAGAGLDRLPSGAARARRDSLDSVSDVDFA